MNHPRIIALETSGRMGSVAIAEGPTPIGEAPFTTDREHARDLIPILNDLMLKHGWTPSQVNHCYLSIGPGSFTGLRVAVTFARHFALTTGAKLCAVPTLDVIAENGLRLARPPERLAAMLDAKSKRVFGAIYELKDGRYIRTVDPILDEPPKLLALTPALTAVIGEGTLYHADAITAAGGTIIDMEFGWPLAANVHRLGWLLTQAGQFTPANELVPYYLRRPEAEEIWERRTAEKSAKN